MKIINENDENINIFIKLYTATVLSGAKNIEINIEILNNDNNKINIFDFLSIIVLFFIEYIIPYAIKNIINISIAYNDTEPYSKKLLFIFCIIKKYLVCIGNKTTIIRNNILKIFVVKMFFIYFILSKKILL